MQCLIDGDLLLYEVAFGGQFKEETEDGEFIIVPRNFDDVAIKFDEKVTQIEAECWATEPSIVYMTGKTNFRNAIAKKKPYKGNRKQEKPFHYGNLKAYAKAMYDVRWEEGLEADDLMTIEQALREDTIICTRDKDLRIGEGMHFGWACGLQEQFGPLYVDKIGTLELIDGKKIKGTGLLFFYSQIITGDTVDNIAGLPRGGPALAYKSLHGLTDEQEMFEAVSQLYKAKYEETWEEEMLEQGQLLWMVNELVDGKPVMWEFPNGR
jgi:5'-3' exonuclease